MNSDLVQDVRYRLQKRVRRLNSTNDADRYVLLLRQFWHFLATESLLSAVLADLQVRQAERAHVAEEIWAGKAPFDAKTEEEHAGLAVFLLRQVLDTDKPEPLYELGYHMADGRPGGLSEATEVCHELLTEPLYEYLDEALDDQRAVLGVLERYKHRCEWFRAEDLYTAWSNDTRRGEKRLGLDLYEYLFDEGIQFYIEPTSISGAADLVAAQEGREPLIADAKIFDPEKGKGAKYIAEGFHQLHVYTQDHNEDVGYLIVFKTTGKDLRFALPATQGFPFLTHNGKTVYFVLIDIFPHEKSASKRGLLEAQELTETDLIRILDEPNGA